MKRHLFLVYTFFHLLSQVPCQSFGEKTTATLRVSSTSNSKNSSLQLNATTTLEHVTHYTGYMWNSLMQCTAPSSTDEKYLVLKEGHTCAKASQQTAFSFLPSEDKSLKTCYNKCNDQAGCFYFNYGQSLSDTMSTICQWVHTASSTCPETFNSNKLASFYKISNDKNEIMKAVGNGWVLVRTLAPKSKAWFAATDNLAGTDEYGDPGLGLGASWSIPFDTAVPNYDEFLFLTGDCERFIVSKKNQVVGENYDLETTRSIVRSSISTTTYQAKWTNRKDFQEEPWVSLNDHDHFNKSYYILYGENSFSYDGNTSRYIKPETNFNVGIYVYIRKSDQQVAPTMFRLAGSAISLLLPAPLASTVCRVVHLRPCRENSCYSAISAATAPPPAPQVKLRVINSTFIKATMFSDKLNDGGNKLLHYNVQVVGGGANRSFVVLANQSKTFFLNIRKANTIPQTVLVSACNSFGCGKIRSSKTGIPGPVTNFKIRVDNSTTLVATAVAPVHDGGSSVNKLQYYYNYNDLVLNGKGVCLGTKDDYTLEEMQSIYKDIETQYSSSWISSKYFGTGLCGIASAESCASICNIVAGCKYFSHGLNQEDCSYGCYISKTCAGGAEYSSGSIGVNYKYERNATNTLAMFKYHGGNSAPFCSPDMCAEPSGLAPAVVPANHAKSQLCDSSNELQIFRMDPIEGQGASGATTIGWFKLRSKKNNFQYCWEMSPDKVGVCNLISLQLCDDTSDYQIWRFDKWEKGDWNLGLFSYNKPYKIVNPKTNGVLDANGFQGCKSNNIAWGCPSNRAGAKKWVLVPAGISLTSQYPRPVIKDIMVPSNIPSYQHSIRSLPDTTYRRTVSVSACNTFGCSALSSDTTQEPGQLKNVHIRISGLRGNTPLLSIRADPGDDGGSQITKYVVEQILHNTLANFKIFDTGTCETHGFITITNIDLCLEAGRALSNNNAKTFRSDQPTGGYKYAGTDRTKGCTFHSGNTKNDIQFFKYAKGNCGTANFHCVCGKKKMVRNIPITPGTQQNVFHLANFTTDKESDVLIYPCNAIGCNRSGKITRIRLPSAPLKMSVRLLHTNMSILTATIDSPKYDGNADVTSYTLYHNNFGWRRILKYGSNFHPKTIDAVAVGDINEDPSEGFAKLSDAEINSFSPDSKGYHYYRLNSFGNGREDEFTLFIRTKAAFNNSKKNMGFIDNVHGFDYHWNSAPGVALNQQFMPIHHRKTGKSESDASPGCDVLYDAGQRTSGQYWIRPLLQYKAVHVWCDMTDSVKVQRDGGWTLVYKTTPNYAMSTNSEQNINALKSDSHANNEAGKLEDRYIRALCADQYMVIVDSSNDVAGGGAIQTTYFRFKNIYQYGDDQYVERYYSSIYRSESSEYTTIVPATEGKGFNVCHGTVGGCKALVYCKRTLGKAVKWTDVKSSSPQWQRFGDKKCWNNVKGWCGDGLSCCRKGKYYKEDREDGCTGKEGLFTDGHSCTPLPSWESTLTFDVQKTEDDCSRWFLDRDSQNRWFSTGTGIACNQNKRINVQVSKLVHYINPDYLKHFSYSQNLTVSTFGTVGTQISTYFSKSCTLIGCSKGFASFTLSVPDEPQSGVLRITSSNKLYISAAPPLNDGGADVTSLLLVFLGSGNIKERHNIPIMPNTGGATTIINSTGIATSPKTFSLFSITQLGISANSLDLKSTLPSKPSYVYASNMNNDIRKLNVSLRGPHSDGNAEIVKFNLSVTCYESNNVERTIVSEIMLSDMGENVNKNYNVFVDSPSDTTNTCRLDVQVCTFVGCSQELASSWNIGLNSDIELKTKNIGFNWNDGSTTQPGNMTVVMRSIAEKNKAQPATTDIRWTHLLGNETRKTTQNTFDVGVTKLHGKITGITFSEEKLDLLLFNLNYAGELVYKVEGRHCSAAGLCSDWFHIYDTPTFTSPSAPKITSVTSPKEGGSIVATIQQPTHWGYHSVIRGRKFQCSVIHNGQQIGTNTIVHISATESVGTVTFTNLLSKNEYTITARSMNGNEISNKFTSAVGRPRANIPRRPTIPPTVLEVYSKHIVVKINLPSMMGAPISQCTVHVGEVGLCGVNNALYKISKKFVWTDAGFETEDIATSFNTAALNPPIAHSEHVLTIDNLEDDEEYVVKHTCSNEMGKSPESIPHKTFKTPPVLQERKIGWLGSDTTCKESNPNNKCKSLSEAIKATPFPNVKFKMDAGVYRQRTSHVVQIFTNGTNISKTVVGQGEDFPISFTHVKSEVHGVKNDPHAVVFACSGKRCFDFSIGYSLVKLIGVTLRDGFFAGTSGSDDSVGGGAIYSPKPNLNTVEIINCIFYNNTSTENGGAIYIVRVADLKITNTIFVKNEASKSGGAFFVDSSMVSFLSVSFKNNVARDWGGAIRAISKTLGSAINFNAVTTDENIAGRGGGVLSATAAIINIDNSNGRSDKASRNGGGGGYMVLESCTLTMRSCTLKNTSAREGGGGSILATGSRIQLIDVIFNQTSSTSSSGGAILCILCTLNIEFCYFMRNSATGDKRTNINGGSIALKVNSVASIVSSNFTSNVASSSAGALNCDGCARLIVKNSIFESNAAGRGGAVSITGEILLLDDRFPVSFRLTSFVNNEALSGGGGAIFYTGPEPILTEIYHSKNTAKYGDYIATDPRILTYVPSTTKITNTKVFGPTVKVSDYYGNQVMDSGSSTSITLQATSTTSQPFGNLYALVGKDGIANFYNFGIAGAPGKHEILVTSSQASIRELLFNIVVEDCLPGFFLSQTKKIFSCTPCEPGYYSNPLEKSIGVNPSHCFACPKGSFQPNSGSNKCRKCAPNLYSSAGAISCGNPIIDPSISVVRNLIRYTHRDDEYKLILSWEYPDELRNQPTTRPMVDVALSPDFSTETRGLNGNLTVVVNQSYSSATVTSAQPIHDLVIYSRVRIDNGQAVGFWSALLEPWLVTSDCDDENFLDNLGHSYRKTPDTWKTTYPDLWNCTKCPEGSSCLGNVLWRDVKAKFGWWRVDSKNNEKIGIPDEFAKCFFGAACLGVPNLAMAGKYFNGSAGNKMTEANDLAILGTKNERCNWEWGHAQKCKDGLKVQPNGDPVLVDCRLCYTCREGFKKMGRARCKLCPETETNRVLLIVGAVTVTGAGITVGQCFFL
jgi:hypothetical protein